MVDDAISREWSNASEAWADFVRMGKDYFREEMNNPAMFQMIGDVNNSSLLDLSCGEGYNTRMLAKKGAVVTGVDFSEEMIKLASREEEKQRLGIRYIVADAADLKDLENESFNMVTCFMALMDIEHYEEAVAEVARVLRKNGRFVFSITHPCFDACETADGETIAQWRYTDDAGTSDVSAAHMEIRRYFLIARCPVPWNMERLLKPFETTAFHRTLTDYFQALHKGGFAVTRLVEPKPTTQGASEHPPLRKHMLIPHSIVIEAMRQRTR
jgi:2-polyprenyl-3-methyl-5-hydroxy-6-metoxy-1,4-benzoquinol methylase